MTDLLADKVALVTGGAGGIGSAITRVLAEAGARLIVTYHHSQEQAEALIASLPGTDHLAVQVAVDDTPALGRLAALVAEQYGTLDVLVNNAGMTRFVPHADLNALDDDLIDEIFRVNWRGAFASIRAFQSLLANREGGLVVNISSLGGVTGLGSNVAYCASKAAMNSMTLSLARALAPTIRVVSVSPGLVEGKYAETFDPVWRQEQADKTPLKRLATAEDVARAVIAVATQLTFTTGAIIQVDGGRLLT